MRLRSNTEANLDGVVHQVEVNVTLADTELLFTALMDCLFEVRREVKDLAVQFDPVWLSLFAIGLSRATAPATGRLAAAWATIGYSRRSTLSINFSIAHHQRQQLCHSQT